MFACKCILLHQNERLLTSVRLSDTGEIRNSEPKFSMMVFGPSWSASKLLQHVKQSQRGVVCGCGAKTEGGQQGTARSALAGAPPRLEDAKKGLASAFFGEWLPIAHHAIMAITSPSTALLIRPSTIESCLLLTP